MAEDASKQIEELENKLLEQEHRIIPIIQNLLQLKDKYKNDPDKKSAVYKSIIFRLFSPGTVIGAGIGIISLLGFFIALRANYLLESQNQKIDIQNYLVEAQRRSSLMFELTSIHEQIQKEVDFFSHCKELRGSENVEASKLVEGYGCDAINSDSELLKIQSYTKSRIVALSSSLKPYRYLITSSDRGNIAPRNFTPIDSIVSGLGLRDAIKGPELIAKELSPERGQMLLSLKGSKVDLQDLFSYLPDFSQSVLDYSNFYYVNLTNVDLKGSSLTHSDLTGAILKDSFLEGVDFSHSKLGGADFMGSNCQGVIFKGIKRFMGARLDHPRQFIGADFTNANLEGVIVPDKNWLDTAQKEKYNIKGIDYSKWTIKAVENNTLTINVITAIGGAAPESS